MNRTRLLAAALAAAALGSVVLSALTLGAPTPVSADAETTLAMNITGDGIREATVAALADASRGGPGATDGGVVPADLAAMEHAYRSLQDLGPPGLLLIAGYSRNDDSDPLENGVRKQVFDAISRSPGTYPVELAERTRIPRSTVRYHVRILEEEGLVFGEKLLGKQRYFPSGSDDVELHAALGDEASRSVLTTVDRLAPVTVSRLAGELDRAPSTVSYHLSRLSEMGLVERERADGEVRNRLTAQTRLGLRNAERIDVADAATAQSSSSD